MQARSIEEVIKALDDIIDWSIENKNRLGYFAALYHKVTVRVKEGIESKFFDDNARMEQLDVLFANRYLAVFHAYRNGNPVTKSWQVTLNASTDWSAIVLQHLLLGINAHINLDLGIAAAQTSPGNAIDNLKGDFDKINGILASLVNDVQNALTQVWPMLRLLDWIAGRSDEQVIHFSIEIARRNAWTIARNLAQHDRITSEREISTIDAGVAQLGNMIQHPGAIVGSITNVIRLGELKSVPSIIGILRNI